MNANYIIETQSGEVFGGWSRLGQMCLKPKNKRDLAYRMSKTVALRNINKVKDFARCECRVVQF